ncbi:hypothetical protein Aduo_007905 [Ancylostoma duodenale]
MFFFVFRLLLVFALLAAGATWYANPCDECMPSRPNGCCKGPSTGRVCCWTRKKRDVEPVDFKPLENVEPIDFQPLDE